MGSQISDASNDITCINFASQLEHFKTAGFTIRNINSFTKVSMVFVVMHLAISITSDKASKMGFSLDQASIDSMAIYGLSRYQWHQSSNLPVKEWQDYPSIISLVLDIEVKKVTTASHNYLVDS